ncbi:MAG: ABC-F family ATP-binding cassette domain-containing protein [Syntrophomonadaceae bacterium]|nr:ABC-F family ATP-binding cassette domain-containing protein [Syntrophomonadaceae bacterium]
MIVLQAHDIRKSFGAHEVLAGVGLVLHARERLGLVGVNGCGKSTLLKCLTGELEPDGGELVLASGLRLGYMAQQGDLIPALSAWDNVMRAYAGPLALRERIAALEGEISRAAEERLLDEYAQVTALYEQMDGYSCESNARRILVGLGFAAADFERPAAQFSGGQRTRLSLAKLLASAPEVLLLDEPSNDLDIASVEWLEDYLKNYPGSLVIVSHDRRLLDRVCTHTAEIRRGRLRCYQGNYSAYRRKREREDEAERRAYDKQQEEIRAAEEFVRRYKAGVKARQARGRQSQLDRLERLEAPAQELELRLKAFKPRRQSGEIVLQAENLSKSYHGRPVFAGAALEIRKGERVGIVGPNGSGKTTLLKILLGELAPDSGWAEPGSAVDIAYFDQGFEGMSGSHSVLEEVLEHSALTVGEARNLLGAMLFKGDEVFQSLDSLSGGQKARLKLLFLMLSGANCLVLDEPTNHLDMESCQALEDMLNSWPGTLVMVSHDRYFMDRLIGRVLAFQAGTLHSYLGNYSDFQAKMSARRSAEKAEASAVSKLPERERQEQRRRRERRLKKLEAQCLACEEQVHAAEKRVAQLEAMLSDPAHYGDDEQLRRYGEEFQREQAVLEQHLNEWEAAAQALQDYREEGAL